jgi:hypothetical protein
LSERPALAAVEYLEQLKMTTTYSHLVEVDEAARRLRIHRIYADARKELYTEIDLPAKTVAESEESFETFCRLLGENLLLDSPTARKVLGL